MASTCLVSERDYRLHFRGNVIMAFAPVFRGTVDQDGRLHLLDAERDQRRTWLDSMKCEDVEISIRKARTQRSLNQNALIHVIATALAEHCGNSVGEMKIILMGECWGWQTVMGHEMPVKQHTADMSVEEASFFLDWAFPWVAEHFPDMRMPDRNVA